MSIGDYYDLTASDLYLEDLYRKHKIYTDVQTLCAQNNNITKENKFYTKSNANIEANSHQVNDKDLCQHDKLNSKKIEKNLEPGHNDRCLDDISRNKNEISSVQHFLDFIGDKIDNYFVLESVDNDQLLQVMDINKNEICILPSQLKNNAKFDDIFVPHEIEKETNFTQFPNQIIERKSFVLSML